VDTWIVLKYLISITYTYKETYVLIMYRQKDVALSITCSSEDLHENYIPASFDEYLMKTRMRHEGHRRTTKCKLQSDYEELDVILFFVQIRYKALRCILRPLLTHLFLCRSAPPRARAATSSSSRKPRTATRVSSTRPSRPSSASARHRSSPSRPPPPRSTSTPA